MNEIVNQKKLTVQCRSTWYKAYLICSHAKTHTKRENCFNGLSGERRQCPKCQPVEIRNDGL